MIILLVVLFLSESLDVKEEKVKITFNDIIPIDDHFPNARDDSSGTSKNTPVTVNVLMNDDGLEDGITLTKLSDPEHGTIIVNDSTIEYTPDTDYLGRDEFEYQICDIDDQCDRATVVIEVRKDNIIPVAVADQAYTLMNQEVDDPLNCTIGQVLIPPREGCPTENFHLESFCRIKKTCLSPA